MSDFLERKADVVAELIGTDALFGITVGDIMFDDLSLWPRYNALVGRIAPRAQQLDERFALGVFAEEFLALTTDQVDHVGQFGRPAQLTLLYHYARLIELVNCCERAIELLEDPEITGRDIRGDVTVGAGEGVGCVEAPRGTLIHHYAADENGLVTKANLIVGSTHNQAPINMSVKQAAMALIKDGTYDQSTLNTIEMAIRAYDP